MESIRTAIDTASQTLDKTSNNGRIEAEVLLCHLLNKNRSYLRAWPEKPLSILQSHQLQNLVDTRQQGVPIAYITGMREFWSREFAVNPAVLIPRPETELLIELALMRIPSNMKMSILDAGTGSGAIAVTLAAERPASTVTAIDISQTALSVARTNASRHNVKNIHFLLSDWFSGMDERTKYDMIVSNPPYIADDDPHLKSGDLTYEPELALISGPRGLDATREIAQRGMEKLRPGGSLILEHGYQQAPAVATLLKNAGYIDIESHPDLQGHLRSTCARMPADRFRSHF